MTRTVRADQDCEILARSALLSWLDETALELVPVEQVEQIARQLVVQES